jgi:hypothetical protein
MPQMANHFPLLTVFDGLQLLLAYDSISLSVHEPVAKEERAWFSQFMERIPGFPTACI